MSSASGSASNKPASKGGSPSKGKGKQQPVTQAEDEPMEWNGNDAEEEEDDEDEDDEDDEGVEEEEEEEEEEDPEIDPAAILSTGRRTRGIRIDYTSREALEKAGLEGETGTDDEAY
ncbi:hypothetical protein V8B97DRAFT_1937903 [Scleroderma yunnanense]